MTRRTQPDDGARVRQVRVVPLILLAGAVTCGLLVDASWERNSADTSPSRARVEAGTAMPAVRGEPTLTSTWFCAGGTGGRGSRAEHTIVVANGTESARTATVTVLTGTISAPPPLDDGAPAEQGPQRASTTTAPLATTEAPAPSPATTSIELPPQSRFTYRLGELSEAKLVSAIVEVDGGGIAVEHEVDGDLGKATAPCSTTASPTWTFPWGVTARGARELLVFMNPFPDDATLDIDFATDEGFRETARFQGFVVPGRSVVGAYVDDLGYKDQVSAHVQVRTGRLIVDRIQMFEGTDQDARRGITLGLGAPSAANAWTFPDGEHSEGVSEQVVVFNPSEGVAEVEVEMRLGDRSSGVVPEPYSLTVLPGRYSLVSLPDEAQPDRVPAGAGHSVLVRSLNGVPVVAERVTVAVEPAHRRGVGATLGAPLGSSRWLFPAGGTSATLDMWIVVLNLSNDNSVNFALSSSTNGRSIPLEESQNLLLEPGGRLAVRIATLREDLPILVTATGPIVAERGLYGVGRPEFSQSMGVPFSDGSVAVELLG